MNSNSFSRALVHYAHAAAAWTDHLHALVVSIPGSEMVARYVRSSYQNDPVRSVVELMLVLFCLFYVLRSRFSTERSRVVLSEDEIDDLVNEWVPEKLVSDQTPAEKAENDARPIIVG
jgi:serine palmitoyltransferase